MELYRSAGNSPQLAGWAAAGKSLQDWLEEEEEEE
jgi:hypothetical protein